MRQRAKVNDNEIVDQTTLSPKSNELVVAVIGYAGSGCSVTADVISAALYGKNYDVKKIKISKIIEEISPESFDTINDDIHAGANRLRKGKKLQDEGDKVRKAQGSYALAVHAIRRIKEERGSNRVGENRLAFVIDSLKHPDEVELLREVYGSSFRLVAVHCDKQIRFSRLHSSLGGGGKFFGADESDVRTFMERDERDRDASTGQQVIKAFEKADFFVANEETETNRLKLNAGLKRFFELILGEGFHRPTPAETAMHAAFSIALRSSCLSRQVGAALVSDSGQLVAVGSNDVPKFGGGTYLEGADPDHRCAVWSWNDDGGVTFRGCHNTRHKNNIQDAVRAEIQRKITEAIEVFSAKTPNADPEMIDLISKHLTTSFSLYEMQPVSDLTEFSRSIHAEMDSIFSAARNGISPVGSTLFCTTYPCHNCARHLVTAGVRRVYYVEPYVKSLATSLHSDAIRRTPSPSVEDQCEMEILPFTGVGHRMYEDFFIKLGDLKSKDGSFRPAATGQAPYGTRLNALEVVEENASGLVP